MEEMLKIRANARTNYDAANNAYHESVGCDRRALYWLVWHLENLLLDASEAVIVAERR